MLAGLTKAPELALDKDEAEKLAAALANVAAYYPMVINPKYLAWIQLGTVCAGVYGTRAIAISIRLKKEREEKARQSPNVIGMTGFNAP